MTRVFQLDESGQHEAALRAMDEVVKAHADNPEVWGRKALLYSRNGQKEEAEAAIDKAFELFPTYPFGNYLKAHFRLQEGEIPGGLTLLRKSAESYDPTATDLLAQIYADIFDCEMKLNRPLAARAAVEMARRHAPNDDGIHKAIEGVFGAENRSLPASAAQLHAFKPLPAGASAEQRAAWDKALQVAATGKLSDALRAFASLTQGDNVPAAAWFNLGVSQAWLGQNAEALQSLDRYVNAEPDEKACSEAWALAQVLRFGHGLEDAADVVEHTTIFGVRDGQAFVNYLNELSKIGQLSSVQVNEEQGMLTALILEPAGPALTPELAAKQSLKPAAYLILVGNMVRLWNSNKEALDKTVEAIAQKLGNLIVDPQSIRASAKFLDVLGEGLRVPRQPANQEEAIARVRESFAKFFEEEWLHRPLKSLGGVPPVDAGGHGVLRKKLGGVLQYLRECAVLTKNPYDFDRLARKLGLADAAAPTPGAPLDIASLGAAELAGLQVDTLSSPQLDQAYQTALKLDARELAGKFASLLVARPAYPERPDRFPLFQFLINQSVSQSNLDTALDYLNDGERDDCTSNEGKRRNEYELRRGQLHAKRGEIDQAKDVFDRLIARVPTELSYRVNAAETMLSAKQHDKALAYAKEGQAAATKANQRDLEGHFKELMAAAQRK
jgi:tetratricopeptide (TPR) repeat protein